MAFYSLLLSIALYAKPFSCWNSFKGIPLAKAQSIRPLLQHELRYEETISRKTIEPHLPLDTPVYPIHDNLYLFTVNSVKDLSVSGGLSGSSGPLVIILLVEGGSAKTIFRDNLVDIYGATNNKHFPDILVKMHGSFFGHSGNRTGLAMLKYDRSKKIYQVRKEEIPSKKYPQASCR